MKVFKLNWNWNDIKDEAIRQVRGGRRCTNTAGILSSSLMSCQKKNQHLPVSCFWSCIWGMNQRPWLLICPPCSRASARCLPSSCHLTLSAWRLCWWWTWCLRYHRSHNLIRLMHRVHGAPSHRIGDSLCNLFGQQIKFGVNAGAGQQNQKMLCFVSLFPRIHSWFLLKATRNAWWHTADWRALSCSTPSV